MPSGRAVTAATARSAGRLAMSSSRWPLTGSRHSAQGQLSRSQAAGMTPGVAGAGLGARLGMRAPGSWSRSGSLQGVVPRGACQRGRRGIRGPASRRSPAADDHATRPPGCGGPAPVLGTLGIMATRVPQGTARSRGDGPARTVPGPGPGHARPGTARRRSGAVPLRSGRPARRRGTPLAAACVLRRAAAQPERHARAGPGQGRAGAPRPGQGRPGQAQRPRAGRPGAVRPASAGPAARAVTRPGAVPRAGHGRVPTRS